MIALAWALLLAAPGLQGFTLEHARLLQEISTPAVSPDGAWVAYVLDGREIRVCAFGGGEARALAWEGGYVSELRWRPDGAALSFLARDDRGVRQVWALPLSGERARTVTSQHSDMVEYAWSPDGRRLALLAEGAARVLRSPESSATYSGEPVDLSFDGADLRGVLLLFSEISGVSLVVDPDVQGTVHARFREMPWDEAFERLLESHGLGYTLNGVFARVGRLSTLNAEQSSRATGPPLVIDRLGFKDEGAGYLPDRQRRLVIRDFGLGTESALPDVPREARELAWSPDGGSIAFAAAGAPDGRGALSTDIFVVDLGERRVRSLTATPVDEAYPLFAPGGRELVYRREASPRDWPNTTHELVVVGVHGGPSRLLVRGLDREIEDPRLASDGAGVFFRLPERGSVGLARVRLEDGRVETVVAGEREVASFDVGPGGRVAFVSSTLSSPAAMFSGGASGLVQAIAEPNASVVAGLRLPAARWLSFPSRGGVEIDAVFVPPAVRPPGGGPPPVVVWLHGGPYSQYTASFDAFARLLSQAGLAVILPNPRGSSGRGAAFGAAIRGAWGTDDYRDVMAVVDGLVSLKLVDGERLGVGGWSYGGWLTNHLLTRTRRFKAAVSGASLANMLADYGMSDTPVWTERELGLPWTTPGRYVKASPLFEVDRVRTPTLVLCGKEDVRTPLGQSEQWYSALRRVGVESELVIYPGEGHSFTDRSWRDVWERSLAWYARFLGLPPSTLVAGRGEEASLPSDGR